MYGFRPTESSLVVRLWKLQMYFKRRMQRRKRMSGSVKKRTTGIFTGPLKKLSIYYIQLRPIQRTRMTLRNKKTAVVTAAAAGQKRKFVETENNLPTSQEIRDQIQAEFQILRDLIPGIADQPDITEVSCCFLAQIIYFKKNMIFNYIPLYHFTKGMVCQF
jgi:hypothetical protein